MKWYQKKWVKWPLRIFGGFFALALISAILNPSEGPSSITLSDIPTEAIIILPGGYFCTFLIFPIPTNPLLLSIPVLSGALSETSPCTMDSK